MGVSSGNFELALTLDSSIYLHTVTVGFSCRYFPAEITEEDEEETVTEKSDETPAEPEEQNDAKDELSYGALQFITPESEPGFPTGGGGGTPTYDFAKEFPAPQILMKIAKKSVCGKWGEEKKGPTKSDNL